MSSSNNHQQQNADTVGASNTRRQNQHNQNHQQHNVATNADTIGASNKTSSQRMYATKYKQPPSTSLMSLFETQPPSGTIGTIGSGADSNDDNDEQDGGGKKKDKANIFPAVILKSPVGNEQTNNDPSESSSFLTTPATVSYFDKTTKPIQSNSNINSNRDSNSNINININTLPTPIQSNMNDGGNDGIVNDVVSVATRSSNSIFKDRIKQKSVNDANSNDVNNDVNARINNIFKNSLHKSFDDDDGYFFHESNHSSDNSNRRRRQQQQQQHHQHRQPATEEQEQQNVFLNIPELSTSMSSITYNNNMNDKKPAAKGTKGKGKKGHRRKSTMSSIGMNSYTDDDSHLLFPLSSGSSSDDNDMDDFDFFDIPALVMQGMNLPPQPQQQPSSPDTDNKNENENENKSQLRLGKGRRV
jgi:hypothetical protein